MKKLIYSLFAVLMVITSSCKYDDSDLWDSVNNLETRVTNLEALCHQINTNVNSLQTIVYALQDNDYITGINPVYEGGNIIGYTISFTKSPTITIYHGKDGQNGINGTNGTNGKDGKDGRDGQDGYTPLIGVNQDVDGHYYWTLDGEWLLDKNGNKVLAEGVPGKDGQNGQDGKDGQNGIDGIDGKDGKDGQDGINGADGKDGKDGQNGVNGQDGKDGITPQFKIEDGDWYISLDNGLTWQYLGRAQGADGKDGQDGKDGVDGKDGQNGADGAPGKDGVDGKDGQNGADGAPGKDGVDGKDGQNGLDGKDGQNGKDGRDGQDGRDGDSMFSNIDTSDPDFVIFTLADGTQIKLPTWYAFEALKQFCQQLNTNIQSLQTIVNAMEAGDYIVSTTPLMQDGVEIGYTITFAKSGSIVIYHGKNGLNGTNGSNGTNGTNGKDGVNGADGHSPVVGVQRDTDGILYWTIDGEWMLDDNGKKIPVTGKDGKDGQNGTNGTNGKDGQDGKDGQNGTDGKDGQNGTNGKDGVDGKDGITPQLKIQEEYWWISYDNGESWEKLGRATGERGADGQDGKDGTNGKDGQNGQDGKDGQNGKDGVDGKDGDSVFSNVRQDENYVYVTLVDGGEEIAIPKNKPFSIKFDRVEFTVQPGQTYTLNYTITGGDANTKINFYEKNGIKAELYITDFDKGYIEVTTPTSMTPKSIHELIVMVNNGYDRTLMETISFVKGMGLITNYSTIVNSDETKTSITLTTNLSNYTIFIPEKDKSWLSVSPKTRADLREDIISFDLTKNIDGNFRSSIVEIIDEYGVSLETIRIMQRGNTSKEVDVSSNVSLSSLISSSEKSTIESLTITGSMSSSDFSFISGMSQLKYLDISGTTNTTLPSGSTSKSGFSGSFTTIILPSKLTTIPTRCFNNVKNLEVIVFPSSLISIEDYAFEDCTNLSGTLNLPENLQKIGYGAFANCQSLSGNLIIPNKVTQIMGYAFVNCTGFKGDLIFGESLREIGNLAFATGEKSSNSVAYSQPLTGSRKLNFQKIYSKSVTPPSFYRGSYSATNDREKFASSFGNYSTNNYLPDYLGVPKGSKVKYVDSDWILFSTIEEVDFDKLGY